jgi:AbrB family looped-hinge helix DNA binding protein
MKYPSDDMSRAEVVRVGRRYTVVVPKHLREKLGLKEGDLLRIRIEEGKLILERVANPFKVLEEIIGEPYSEEKEEKEAERWLLSAHRRR